VGAADSQVTPRQFDTGAVVCQLTMKATELYAVSEELVRSLHRIGSSSLFRAGPAGPARSFESPRRTPKPPSLLES